MRITENLVLLLNDTVQKLFFSVKTSVDISEKMGHDTRTGTC